jgi:hypothetical protein
VRPYGDYYNEDYFYEYRPVQINRRQGGQTWAKERGGLSPLTIKLAITIFFPYD